MSVIPSQPITKARLLSLIRDLPMPNLVRHGLFGLSYQERGRYRSTAADELSYPAQAILARVLTEHPGLVLPAAFPSVEEFHQLVAPVEPQKRRQSLRLGMENSYVSRCIRAGDVPCAAAWTLMALVAHRANGRIAATWAVVERAALAEAAARGIADIDTAGRWVR